MSDECPRYIEHPDNQHPAFQEGVEDARNGRDRLKDIPFFSLKTVEDRWYFHGWQWQKSRERL